MKNRLTKSKKPRLFEVDSPFYMWVTRPDCEYPIFMAYCDYDTWLKKGK